MLLYTNSMPYNFPNPGTPAGFLVPSKPLLLANHDFSPPPWLPAVELLLVLVEPSDEPLGCPDPSHPGDLFS